MVPLAVLLKREFREETMPTKQEHQMVPLAVLLKRELSNEKIGKPDIIHGEANQSKKGEDFTLLKTECERVPGDEVTTFSVFAYQHPQTSLCLGRFQVAVERCMHFGRDTRVVRLGFSSVLP